MGDGGESLHVMAKQSGESPGLGLTQLRELLGHVRDRTVVLTKLRATRGRVSAGGKAQLSQRIS